MHHGVHTGGRCDRRGQAHSQLCIQQHQIGEQSLVDDACLGAFACGDDGNAGYLRAGTGRGGHHDQRQARRAHALHAVQVLQCQRRAGLRQTGNNFGHVQAAAATHAHDQVNAFGTGLRHGGQNHRFRGVGLHPCELHHFKTRLA